MENEILQKISSEYVKEKKKIANYDDKNQLNEQDLLYKAFLRHQSLIEKTNGIFVYMGTYDNKNRRVSRYSENASYSEYMDLEIEESVEILISNRQDFEKNFKVIFPTEFSEQKNFFTIQLNFIEDCINYGQDIAVQKVLANNKKI